MKYFQPNPDFPIRDSYSLPPNISGYKHIMELLRRSTGFASRLDEEQSVKHLYRFKTTDGKDFTLQFTLYQSGGNFLTVIAQEESFKNKTIPDYVQQIIDGLNATPVDEFNPNQDFRERLSDALNREREFQKETAHLNLAHNNKK